MWHLHQDARAVASVFLAATCAAMFEVAQNLQCLMDDGVRLAVLQIDDKADATRIVFVGGIIKPLRTGWMRAHFFTVHLLSLVG